MKKLMFSTMMLIILSGCGNPFPVSKSSEKLSATNSDPSLIKLDPLPEASTSVGGFAPVSDLTNDVVSIIQNQDTVPQTMSTEVVAVAEIPEVLDQTVSSVIDTQELQANDSVKENSEPVPSLVESTTETVAANPAVVVENSDSQAVSNLNETDTSDEKDTVNLPVADLENVVYMAHDVAQSTVSEVSDVVQSTVAEPAIETNESSPVSGSIESTSLPVNDVDANESLDEDVPPTTTQAMDQEVDSSVKETLSLINYSDSTAENTTITYEKKKGQLEAYYVYSQKTNSYSWIKELAVYVENGTIKLIQSLNKKDLSLFSAELSEIASMEKEFSKKIKSKDVSNMKETIVSYIVKSKKNKKTFKLPNKKFGKKSKKHKHR